MILRDYQKECADAAIKALANGSRSMLAVLPTGVGKTVAFCEVVHRRLTAHPGTRAMIVAHKEELIFQAADKFELVTGESAEIEMADFRAAKSRLTGSRVVVASVQTLNAGRKCNRCDGHGCPDCLDGFHRRMLGFKPDDFSTLIVDEAHHARAETYERIIRYFSRNPNLRILGVTATPDRTDEKTLGRVFDSVAYSMEIIDAIDEGWLVPIQQEFVECSRLDLSGLTTPRGDFSESDLENILLHEKALHEVVGPTVEIAAGRPTLVFAASVATADRMTEIFNRYRPASAIRITGPSTDPLTGEKIPGTSTEERRRLLAEFKDGKYQFLVGCGVFLEGFDEPRIEVVAMARPTKSRSLYAQAIGRGTRPAEAPGVDLSAEQRQQAIAASRKPNLLVLDFVGNAGRHKLISTADILGGKNHDEETIEKAVRRAREAGGCCDMRSILNDVCRNERERQEEERRQRDVRARVNIKARKLEYSRQQIDPFAVFGLDVPREIGADLHRSPTRDQVGMLRSAKVPDEAVRKMSRGQAGTVVGEIVRRRAGGLCTYKQAIVLQRYGEPTNLKIGEASDRIGAIKANGWKALSAAVSRREATE